MSIKFDDSEVRAWINNQSNRERATKQVATVVAVEMTKNLISRSTGERSTGDTARKTRRDIRKTQGGYSAMITFAGDVAQAFASYETGRKPGRMPPITPMQVWAGKKLGDPKLGFMVARKIAREGSEKYKRGGPKHITNTMEWVDKTLLPRWIPKLLDAYVE